MGIGSSAAMFRFIVRLSVGKLTDPIQLLPQLYSTRQPATLDSTRLVSNY